jgi:anti-anti-sigma regulatory factor
MAASSKKKLMDCEPRAVLERDNENRILEEAGMNAGDIEIEMEMNNGLDFPEPRVFDEVPMDEAAASVIHLNATLTIQHVVELHEQLKKSYLAHRVLEINASQVASIDTATLQLLVALKKNAVKHQKEVVFVEPSRRFIESAGLLGLLDIIDIS